jgi:hypothetical protein
MRQQRVQVVRRLPNVRAQAGALVFTAAMFDEYE